MTHDSKKSYLFASIDFSFGKNYDAALAVNFHYLRHTIRVARMIDVTRQSTGEGSVHHTILVQPEHVDTTILYKTENNF